MKKGLQEVKRLAEHLTQTAYECGYLAALIANVSPEMKHLFLGKQKMHSDELRKAQIILNAQIDDVAQVWSQKDFDPDRSGWFATWSHEAPLSVTPRYFDNAASAGKNWFIARSNGGSDSIWPDGDGEEPLQVNMYFDMWARLPEPPTVEFWQKLG